MIEVSLELQGVYASYTCSIYAMYAVVTHSLIVPTLIATAFTGLKSDHESASQGLERL
jgi:hypothetical protein